MSSRLEFVLAASVEGANMTLLCKRHGITRPTGYKWLARWREADGQLDDEILEDRSRRPKRVRCQTPPEVEQAVLEVRDRCPAWGGRKIRHVLLRDLKVEQVPSASTITAILHRHGRIDPAESLKRQPCRRFERSRPNELWQMDFKGHFQLSGGRRCHPLTISDDHSRFALLLAACYDELGETVRLHLISVFRLYGLPDAILTDNSSPWGVPNMPRCYSALAVWLMDHDVRLIHGRPYHPQTQGKQERLHRTLKREVLQGRQFVDCEDVQRQLDAWRQVYNFERPHEALNMNVPSHRYRPSPRDYRENPLPFEYDTSFQVRKVRSDGRIVYRGREFFLSTAFGGRPVGIREPAGDAPDGMVDVYYRTFKISRLQLQEGRRR